MGATPDGLWELLARESPAFALRAADVRVSTAESIDAAAALELVGFKSFADKTRLEFPPGITVVVAGGNFGKNDSGSASRLNRYVLVS